MKLYITIFIILFTANSMLIGAEAPAHGGLSRDARVREYYDKATAGKTEKAKKADAKSTTPSAATTAGIPEKIDLTQIARDAQKKLEKPLLSNNIDCRRLCSMGCDSWQSVCEELSTKSQEEKNQELKKPWLIAPNAAAWLAARCPYAAALCAGADPKVLEENNRHFRGVEHNDYEYTNLELERGLDPNSMLSIGPVFALARTVKMAKLLMQYGGKIPATDGSWGSLLHSVAIEIYGDTEAELIKFYVQYIHPDTLSVYKKRTSLHDIAEHCWRADDIRRYNNNTALADAKSRHLRKARYLLEAGARTDIKNNEGETARDVAEKQFRKAPNRPTTCKELADMLRKAEAEQKRKGS